MKKYKARPGSILSNKDAQVVGKRLTELGDPSPEEIVDDARKPESPLHGYFEWDASKAHHTYLLHQARLLVGAVQVFIVGEATTKAFHSVIVRDESGESRRTYVSTERVSLSEDLRQQVLKRALAEAEAWRLRYAEFESSFRAIFSAIAETRKSVSKVGRKPPTKKGPKTWQQQRKSPRQLTAAARIVSPRASRTAS